HRLADEKSTILSRRDILRGMIFASAAAFLPGGPMRAQTAPAAGIVDFHHHFGVPRWLAKQKEAKTQGWQTLQTWTPAKSLEAMDNAGVSTALLSCTAPGPRFPGMSIEESRGMAREVNESGAKIVSDYKGRFGLLATLNPLDVDSSLKEIDYALGTLRAVGFGLITSYGDKWIGDPAFQPVFDELNRRKALVFLHPTAAPCCANLIPNIQPTVFEYNTDTSRAIANILINGSANRTLDVRYVFCHAGGTAPYLVQRLGIAPLPQLADALRGTPAPGSRLWHLRRFYYDVAQSTNPIQLQALKLLAGLSQAVFGADFPYSTIVDHVEALQKCGLTASELEAIHRGNALRLLPQLRA
ncbi:MAG: amidohydrolase, partial [Acidobacteriota bacterium]|nr:amidohydrolase [Acidobacteriota bacterium]